MASFEKLRAAIIEQMGNMPYVDSNGRAYRYGEFFPIELSSFAYNETIAQEYFSLTKKQAKAEGYRWQASASQSANVTLESGHIPDGSKELTANILQKVIQCAHTVLPTKGCNEQCTKAFRLIAQELTFYKEMGLPLPRLCPNCRHYERLAQCNPLTLWQRRCQCSNETATNSYQNTAQHFHKEKPCPNSFKTSYASERPEIVYCEGCYLREVA